MQKMLNQTIGQLLNQLADRTPDQEAIAYVDRPYRRTWRKFREECDLAARGLLAIGIKKGDHVAIWATNVPEWLVTLFATAKIGAILVTVNTNYKKYELEYLLRQSDAKALVLIDGYKDNDYFEILNEVCPELKSSMPGNLCEKNLPCLKSVICAGSRSLPGAYRFEELYDRGAGYDERSYRALEESLDTQDVINMQYTSGTTGFPKGVMLTHYNIVNNGRGIGDCMKLTEKDKLCIPVPLFHCFGLVLGVMACLTHGTSMVPVEYFRPSVVMEAIDQEGCTAVHGVPTMFIAMLEHENFRKHRFAKLRTGVMAGSPCPEKIMRKVVDLMHMREITITYGETEASPACTMTTTGDPLELRVCSVGKAMPGVETKVVNPLNGKKQPANVPGEFCSRGYNTMKGYYKMPEETERVIDGDGWLHTGDLASVDEQGYYRITGRIKDMIIRGGENIYPKEIEEFLYTHPAVRDVQVVGVPSEEYGEEILAFIIRKAGESISEDDVKNYVSSRLAGHKVPKYVRFLEEFPVTASGKIQKYKLREMALSILKTPEPELRKTQPGKNFPGEGKIGGKPACSRFFVPVKQRKESYNYNSEYTMSKN